MAFYAESIGDVDDTKSIWDEDYTKSIQDDKDDMLEDKSSGCAIYDNY